MIKAFKMLHQFYRGFDGAATCLENTIGKSICMPSCGMCCECNTPRAMTIEAMNAISILCGEGKLAKTLSTAEGWLLDRNKEATIYEGMPSGRFLTPQLRAEYDALALLPCPFLSENKECSIHSARPMVCRSFGVTRVGNYFCPRGPGKGETLTQHIYINAPGLMNDIKTFKETNRKAHPEWVIFGFLPAIIYRAAEEKKFREMVKDNRIASAKIIGTHIDSTLMWQVQENQLKSGVSGDLVVC